ncbi:hypothetical protein M5D96_013837 [Drosophila gunungcola]|uniref:Uncharacterized protein n=1 Tax=Drosophila gunungcola TaxID=103775 RepID=A0A9P9YB94_9MUSC|nr:hypothetical protein M5D96_013837 [Drosophila gunungcola]
MLDGWQWVVLVVRWLDQGQGLRVQVTYYLFYPTFFQQRNNHAHANAHSAGGVATERSADRSHGHSHGVHGGHVEQIELLIDEKCRILNKTGTPKSSALHLANWMKGQLDKQQEQARLAAIARSQENVSAEDEQLIFNSDSEQDERITYWTRQQLEKRTKELNLAKENGALSAKPNFGGKRLSGVEELSMSATSDIYSTSEAEGVTSVISQSHSTTSDSQVRRVFCTLFVCPQKVR